jgi:hypothetical protein
VTHTEGNHQGDDSDPATLDCFVLLIRRDGRVLTGSESVAVGVRLSVQGYRSLGCIGRYQLNF